MESDSQSGAGCQYSRVSFSTLLLEHRVYRRTVPVREGLLRRQPPVFHARTWKWNNYKKMTLGWHGGSGEGECDRRGIGKVRIETTGKGEGLGGRRTQSVDKRGVGIVKFEHWSHGSGWPPATHPLRK